MVNSDQLKVTYDYALAYIANGYSVIPLKPKSKRPCITSWKRFTEIKSFKRTIRKLVCKYRK